VAAVTLPWSVRNTRANGQFVWMLTTEGEDLWDGNNPFATGHSYATPSLLVLETLTPEERRDLRSQPNELAQSRWFHDRAIAFIRSQPARFVSLTIRKFVYFWSFSPQTGTLYPIEWLRAYQLFYVGVLILAVLGGRAAFASGRPDTVAFVVLLMLFLLGLSALQSFYYVEGRHRWAIEPMLLVLSGGGAAVVAARWRSRDRVVA